MNGLLDWLAGDDLAAQRGAVSADLAAQRAALVADTQRVGSQLVTDLAIKVGVAVGLAGLFVVLAARLSSRGAS